KPSEAKLRGVPRSLASDKYAYFGRTRTMKNVKIISDKKNLIGKIIKAKIIKANIWNLEACLLKKQGKIK
ncbi:hypothetical protein KJ761_00455, partial [Patescibacteria group bacterium]|nr:hypothetical protein [Patescibacteria group bacterium]